MADSIKPGTEQDGYRFVGGDPAKPQSWEPVGGIKIGTIEDGFQFLGGDPADQTNWKKAEERSYLGAAAEAGGRTLLAAGARILDEMNPFTLSESDAATLYKSDPAKLKDVLQNHTALALSRFANEQTERAKQVMQQAPKNETGLISGKPLGELEYATLDPDKAAYLSPTRVAGDVLQSLPTTVALAVSGYLTKGRANKAAAQAEAAALARGATQAEAKAAATQAAIAQGAETMAVTGAAGEGAVGFATQMNQTANEARGIKQEALEKSPKYQELLAQGYTPETAREQLIADTARESGIIAGAVDAATNAIGGRVLGKVIGEGGALGARAAKGFATESATEMVQSGGEQLGQNVAVQRNLDPSQDLLKGVGEAVVAGGVVGGVTGGATAAVFGSRQRAQAEANLGAAQTIDQAIAAADDLAASVSDLTQAIGEWNGTAPVPAPAAAAAPAPAPGPNIAELQARADREAELLKQANGEPVGQQPAQLREQAARLEAQAATFAPDEAAPSGQPSRAQALVAQAANLRAQADQIESRPRQAGAGFEADRQNALAQVQAGRAEPKPRVTENFVDLTPMDPRQAQARLAVLRDETAQAGGNALGLVAVSHPSQPGKFAIMQQPLPSLDLGTPAPTVTPEQAQFRLETAALTGKVEQAKAEDQNSRQVVIDRALRNVEERGGVASPAEARIFQEANLGTPYDRIDQSLAGELSMDQKLTQATGIALDKAPRSEMTQQTGPSEQQLLQQENNARSDSRMQQLAQERAATQAAAATDTRTAPQAPAVDTVIAALRTPGATRTAEQNLTISQAQQRMAPGDFQIAQTAATGPFNLSQEQRVRLREMRSPTQSVVSAQQIGEAPVAQATPEAAPGLMGERVARALGLPSNGTVVTTTAKFSTQRTPAPGMTETVTDTETFTDENGQEQTREVQHQFSVVDAGKLGGQGKLLQQIARIFGKRLVVFQSPTLKADGFVRDGDNRNIYVNANSEISPLAVFGHELLHILKREAPQAYAALEAVVKRNMSEEGKAGFDAYYGSGATLEELTADLMGNQFQSTEFWADVFEEIARQNPEGARAAVLKVAAALNRAINAFMKLVQQGQFKSDEFVSDLQAIKAAVKDATVAYAQQQREASIALDRETEVQENGTDVAQGVTASKRRADFTDPEDRLEVSTTTPKPAPKKGRLSNSYDEKWVIDGQDVRASEKHIAAVMKALQSYNTLSGKGNAKKLMQELHDTVVENLLWLHDLVPADVRQRAKLWYDGANRIATDWTAKYGVSLRQASGVLAALSPQMDWFKNVSLGERVISVWKERQNEAWTPAMTDWVQSWVNASKDVDTKASRQAVLDEVRPLQGVKLADMNMRQAALFVRAFDETYFERQYRLVTPEGGFGEYVTNSDDGEASVTWGGFDTIEKAVSILNDGSFKNIDEQLGDEHKVRNFYNNIISPGSADGHVTIDTHAVAAALIKGLSGSSQEVKDNFGAAGGNAETGAGGTYGLFADAYRDAAAKRGILPREMQSITWEAVRALFPAALKDKLAPQIDAVWDRFKKGELTREQARDEVKQLAGGIRKMAWEGSDEGKPASAGGTSFSQDLDADPAKRQARTLAPEVAKDKISVSLSASTSSIPGIAELQAAAANGDAMAHDLLQNIALDNLRHLLAGTSARVKANGATGLYGGYVESSLSATVSFADNDRAQVLAALAKFAENFNQEQVHVRRGVKAKVGTTFDDGSYATPVYRWELSKALSRKQIESIIEKSGLEGLSFGDDFIEAYYVGDFNEEKFARFEQGIEAAAGLVGKAAGKFGRAVERLWPYGQGAGTIGFDRIQGDVSAGDGVRSETAKRVAEYLNSGAKVKAFDQAAEITPEQSKLQGEIAQVYELLPDNDLKNPNVRKAYQELAKEVIRQFKALPVKVEVMNGQGEPYANSAAMRRDILDNNHIFIFGTTPETFGPPGEDFTGHPLLEKTGLKDQNGYELLYNDLLRAVHDYYAHAMSPTQFGPKGEEAAWKNHMSMTPNMWARWALTAETRGQNSWVNFREGAKDLPITEREFARQKAVLLPVEYSLTGDRTVDKPMKEFIAKLGERVRQGTKPAKLSRTRAEQAENDATRIREKYIGTPEWLKAPNGKPTNLTERQWIQVRTPQFKAWFGDWEKHARAENPVGSLWSDENVSKVVDDNGEPLVVYHGTDSGGFTEFNTPAGTKRGDLGIFATSNRAMALTYVKRGRGREIEFADMDREPIEGGDTSGYYASFMNLRNPQEDDFNGAMWSGEYEQPMYMMLDENGDPTGDYAYTELDAERLIDEGKAESYQEESNIGRTTDSVVRDARDYNDGAIIRNVVDDGGGYSSYAGEPTDVFVAFDPNQLKSATQNTGEFGTDTNDMRFSRTRTPEFKRWFGDSKVVDENGEPLVVYHTTTADFDTFDTTRRALGGEGSWFSSRPVKGYGDEGENILPVYLSLQNPKVMDWGGDVLKDKFIAEGYDGVIQMRDGKIITVVAFNPEQIKSATGNNGEFSPTNPDITKSVTRTRSAELMFDQAEIDKLRETGYKDRKKLIDMRIDDFLALADKGEVTSKGQDTRALLAEGKQFRSLPFLQIDRNGKVGGHEGRHRAMALKGAGYDTMPVVLWSENIRWSEQADPESFDYVENWPSKLSAQDDATDPSFSIPFPVSREDADAPYSNDITKSATRTPAFKRWFGDSKVVDSKGEPLVVYHATDAEFDTFDMEADARGNNLAFFSDNRAAARSIIEDWGGSVSRVVKAYLSIQKPFDTTADTVDPAVESWIRDNASRVEEDLRAYDSDFGLSMFQAYLVSKFDLDEYVNAVRTGDWQAVEAVPSLINELRRMGYDGIKMSEAGGTTYAIFRANQAKYTNNKAPTESADMRFSKQRIVGESKRAYTPEQLAMFKNTGRTVEVPTIKERIASLRKDMGKKLAQGIADQFLPLKELSKEAYALARLSKGSAGAFDAFLHHGKLKLTDNIYDGDTTGGFIERVGVPLQGELEDFMWWVAANRAARLKLEGRENLFSDADIAAGKSLDTGTTDYDYTLQHGPEKGRTTRDRTKIYRDAQITFNEFHKNALDMAEQSGLIDAESRKTWENEFYVPFYRVSEEDGGFVGAKISNQLVRQRAFKMLKGGTDKLNSDLLANTLQNWGHLIDAAAKNRAAVASLEAAQKVGVAVEADEATVRSMGKAAGLKKNVVWAMDQGRERYFLIEDPYVMEALTSLEFAGLRGPLMDTLSTFKHWLTIGVTASPAFKIRNLVRDSLQAVATAPLSYNVASNVATGFKASKRGSQDYVSMLASGALIRFGTMEGTKADNTRRLIKDGVDQSTILDSEQKIEAFYRKVKQGIDAYQEVGNRGEEINRASLYKQLRAQGKSHQEASLMARDLMDFSMQGTFTTVRFLTQVVPFMNARIQGLYKLGRAAQEDPRRFSIVVGAVALASIALMAAYQDDDDWKKREDWDRNGNWWFKFGGVAWRIPKPFEVGAIATLAERGLEYFINPEMTGKRLGKNVWDLVMNSLSMNPVPQLAKPIIDLYANKDSFSGRPIETMGMEKLKAQYRYTQSTSMVARGLSNATFGALSPVQYDHILRGYFGWLGSFVVSGADYAIRPLTNEPSRPQADYWKVATQGIASEVDGASSRYVSQMYEQAKVLEQAYGTYRQLLKEGKREEAAAFKEANREELSKYRQVEGVKRAEAKFNERIRMIERSAMDPAVKKEKIREIQAQKDRVARRVAPGLR